MRRNNIFYVFGLQRTGTVFVEESFKANNQHWNMGNKEFADVQNWGKPWKHLIDLEVLKPEEWQTVPTLVVIKNPYTWIESIVYREPIDFFDTQPRYDELKTDDESWHVEGIDVGALATIWNEFYKKWVIKDIPWLDFENVWIFKYEDLITEGTGEVIFKMMLDKFEVPMSAPMWRKSLAAIRPMDQVLLIPPGFLAHQFAADFTWERAQYYRNQFPMELPQEIVKMISTKLDTELMIKSGYHII